MKPLTWLWALILLLACSVSTAEVREQTPEWSAELKGGRFTPDMDQWSTFFSQDAMTQFEAGIAYKPVRQLELAVNAGYLDAKGKGFAPLHGTAAGDVHYELFPIHIALLWRAVFHEDQLLVPYVGGGWSRFGYRQRMEHQSDVTGSADGTHLRGGVQLLLDHIDRHSASAIEESSGIKNSYLFLEYQRTDVTKSGVDLGGTAILGGILIEF